VVPPLLLLRVSSLFGVLTPKWEKIDIFIFISFSFHLVCNGLKLYVCWSYGQELIYVG
jgi:hypothetical protein